MVSKKNAMSASDRLMPSCRPTASSSSGVGNFALAMELSSWSAELPAQVLRDLQRAAQTLRDRLGQRHERVDLSRILPIDHVHAGRAETIRVVTALVAERIEAGGDDHGRRLAGQARRTQRRGAQVRLVRPAPQILLRVPLDALARDDVAILEVAMRFRVEREVDGGVDQDLARGQWDRGSRRALGDDGREI